MLSTVVPKGLAGAQLTGRGSLEDAPRPPPPERDGAATWPLTPSRARTKVLALGMPYLVGHGFRNERLSGSSAPCCLKSQKPSFPRGLLVRLMGKSPFLAPRASLHPRPFCSIVKLIFCRRTVMKFYTPWQKML